MKNIIKEGRYDSFTRQIVKDIMEIINTSDSKLDTDYELPYDINGEESYIHESGLDIELDLRINKVEEPIKYGKKTIPFYVHTYIATDNVLVMDIVIDKTKGKKYYEQLFYKINEDIRHEIEHYTQEKFDNKPKNNVNTAEYSTTFEHHMDPTEISALVHGFYRRAKQEKKPLDQIMSDDIQKEIKDGNLTPEEGEDLMKVFIEYAKKNLTKAQYSSSFRRNNEV